MLIFRVDHHHYFHNVPAPQPEADSIVNRVGLLIQQSETRIVSELTDAVAAATAAVAALTVSSDAAIARALEDGIAYNAKIDSLKAMIAVLQAQVDAGGGTPELLAQIAAFTASVGVIQGKVDALDILKADVLPDPVLEPDPGPVPEPAPEAEPVFGAPPGRAKKGH